ncbi:MAG: small basic protein [Candidatus Aadella gelida]|nr:small basic protein [Candidatus Aadella gelida]
MSQHPSLKGSSLSGKFRSVLKRFEKIKELTEKEKWDFEKDSVYKIPKVKRIKFKVKKAKDPAEGEEGAETPEAEAGAPAKDTAAAPAAEKKGAGKKA